MNAKEILKLIDAGFSAAEIRAMENTPAPAPVETPAPAPVETPAPAPVETPAPLENPAPNGVNLSNEQFAALMQRIAAGGASMDIPPAKNPDDIVGAMYKNIFGGK